jgi:hypothetical protein
MSLAILFHFLCAQHVLDINISIIRSLQLPTTHKRTQWSQSITDSGPYQLKYTYQLQQGDKTHHTKHTTTDRKVTLMLKHPSLQNKTTDVVIHQHSRKLLKMDILMSETCWAHNKWNKIASDIKLVFHSSTTTSLSTPYNHSTARCVLTLSHVITSDAN